MKLLKKLVFPLAGLLSFSLWINPSASVENLPDCSRNPQPLGKTREQLGEKYREYLLKAKKEISSLPIDMSVKFPLGTICPLRIGDTLENPNSQQPNPKLEAIGFVEQTTGKAKAITSASLIEMFDKNLEVVNHINSTPTPTNQNPTNQNSSANENRSTHYQSRNMAVIDLIAIDSQTKQVYLLPDILFISFFRDAFNASLNKKVIPNTYDVNRLDLQRLQEQPQQEGETSVRENQLIESDETAVQIALQKLSSMPPNTRVKIPVPSNQPIQKTILNSGNLQSQVNRYHAWAFITRTGKREPITVCYLISMFQVLRNSSASDSGQQVLTIDLIVYDTYDSQTYLVPDVDLNTFERDALNVVLNDKLIIDTEP